MSILREKKQRTQGGIMLVLEGRLDSANASELEQVLLSEADAIPVSENLVLDFSGVTFVSSMGLRALLKTRKLLVTKGGALQIIHVRDQVNTILRMANIGH